MEHSATSASASAFEDTPWRAVQRAAWEALTGGQYDHSAAARFCLTADRWLRLGDAAEDIGDRRYRPGAGRYTQEIPQAIGARLRDPYTAVYTFERPVRVWFFADDQIVWAVCGTVNAKNAFGGYVGAKPFVVFYKHSKITSLSYDNSVDAGLCPKWHAAGYYE
jgi:hypothetical protein